MNIQNESLLNPKPGDPNGFVTKDGMWAAVPFGKKFMSIHNGQQIEIHKSLTIAKKYIQKQIKANKVSSKP
jgi:hypothetical protein